MENVVSIQLKIIINKVMIDKCELCQKRATWCDLAPIEKGRVILTCDEHVPDEKDRKKRKWTYSKIGWVPADYSVWSAKDSTNK